MTETAIARARRHVTRFNHAVTTGDWDGFVQWFAPDATLEFGGVGVPLVEGREAVLDAYLADPPTDSMHAVEAGEKDGIDLVRFAWSTGGTGTMWITWDAGLVASLAVTFDPRVSDASGAASLAEILALEQLEPLRFRGRVQPPPAQRTFGGEVAGQAVTAAGQTVAEDRHIHSAHMHFLLPGDTTAPVELVVEKTRDGGSFSSRRVLALQRERVIFTMTASFQADEAGLEHAATMPVVPLADDLLPPTEAFADDPEVAAWIERLSRHVDVDARFVGLPVRVASTRGLLVEPRQEVWLRSRQPLGTDRRARAAGLAYLSDVLLLSTALGPHGTTLHGEGVQFATVDHTIWFHRPLAVDDWFLYVQESRWAGGGRALCHGEMYDAAGHLCATTMQEGLIRVPR